MSKITGFNKRLKYFSFLFQELRFPIPSIGSETTTKLQENEDISIPTSFNRLTFVTLSQRQLIYIVTVFDFIFVDDGVLITS
jgi:hypothetical protein